MAWLTNNQRFTLYRYHTDNPRWFSFSSGPALFQVRKLPDVVHLTMPLESAQLARVSLEALNKVRVDIVVGELLYIVDWLKALLNILKRDSPPINHSNALSCWNFNL